MFSASSNSAGFIVHCAGCHSRLFTDADICIYLNATEKSQHVIIHPSRAASLLSTVLTVQVHSKWETAHCKHCSAKVCTRVPSSNPPFIWTFGPDKIEFIRASDGRSVLAAASASAKWLKPINLLIRLQQELGIVNMSSLDCAAFSDQPRHYCRNAAVVTVHPVVTTLLPCLSRLTVGVVLRSYQAEMVLAGCRQNIIVVLPTGSGLTNEWMDCTTHYRDLCTFIVSKFIPL